MVVVKIDRSSVIGKEDIKLKMTLWTRMPELGNQTQGLVGNCRPGGKKNVSVSRVCFVYHKTNYIDCSTWVFNKRFVIMRSIRKEKRVARQVPHARFDSDDEDVVVLDGEEEWLESVSTLSHQESINVL